MIRLIFTLIFCVFAVPVLAAPVLNFTDIISGPATGNTDTQGSGAIVTVYGNNLGSTQGTSTIYVGGVEATQIYYWRNATGSNAGSPADLYTYHKMQEISFAVPATAVSGANTIKVTVDGTDSGTLPFTVRAGNIYFVNSTGDNSNDGDWGTPWLTLPSVFSGDGKISAGDIVYSVGVGSTVGIEVGSSARIVGTVASPVSLIAYPDTAVNISGEGANNSVIQNRNYDNDSTANTYINFSKLSITCAESDVASSVTGIVGFLGMRVVGVEITGPTAYHDYKGAIGGNHQAAGGGKMYGVYIHHYGRDNGVPYNGNSSTEPPYNSDADRTSWDKFQHLYYLSNRFTPTNLPYEIGWNVLLDNPIWQGIHMYDESGSGGWSGTIRIFNNVVKNQRGGAIELDLPDMTSNPDIEVFNNLIITDADDTYNFRAFQLLASYQNVKVWNNTVYGWNSSNRIDNLTDDFRNNIMYDHKGVDFWAETPTSHSNNLFYSSEGTSQPSWAGSEPGNVTGDPLFTDATNEDFTLAEGSPALNTGYDTTSVVATDFLTVSRDSIPALGAFELYGAEPDPDPDPEPTTSSQAILGGNSQFVLGGNSQAILGGVGPSAYVSPTGSAAWDDCQSRTPLSGTAACSLATANANADAGDTVVMRDGTYTTQVRPVNMGSSGNMITYEAYSGETPFIDATGIGNGVVLREVDYIKLDGLEVANSDGHGIFIGNHLGVIESDYNVITNCEVHHCGAVNGQSGVYVGGYHNEIYNNNIHHNGDIPGERDHGLYLMGDYNYIHNNVMSDNARNGVRSEGEHNEVAWNTITDNGYHGISISVDSPLLCTDYAIHHNLITGVGEYGIIIFTTGDGGTPEDIRIYNNTIQATSGVYGIHVSEDAIDVDVKNNIVTGTFTAGISTNVGSKPGLDIDNNIYYGTMGWIWNDTMYSTFANWQTASSMDALGYNQDPDLDASYIPNTGSVAIENGVDVGLPYTGTAPTIGQNEAN